ncbi:MAG TPA: putative glycoside hydrolase [Candidatus Sulfotelmatobacter sp.]|nr:putative glycoside hydrolase [Candidatus Sulfotelmatobacter sp.]
MKKIGVLVLFFLTFFFALSYGFKERIAEIIPKQKRMSERGIYLTAWTARLPARLAAIKAGCKQAGINTLVIDVKEVISQPYLDLAGRRRLTAETRATPNPWLTKLAEELHQDGFILTARIVVFKDDHLVLARHDLGVHLPGGELYRDRKGGKWADPYLEEVRLYNALIAESAAMSGVDEVQFDYVRFAAEGAARYAVYPQAARGMTRVDVICKFLKEAKERVAKYNTSLAVDIFGVTAWQSRVDIDNLGQDLKRMAPYLDVLSPMLYPSHFHAGYDGYANPGSYPYYFMGTGVKKAKEILSGEATVLAPWLQGFNMSSPNYGPDYIREQVRACRDQGVDRFLIWNARNVYDIPFAALKK